MARKLRTIKIAYNKACAELNRAYRAVFVLADNRTDVRFCDIVATHQGHILVEDYNNALAAVHAIRAEMREAEYEGL